MQLTLLATLMLMASAAGAGARLSAKDAWSTIRQARGILINQISYASNFGGDGFFNACVSGQTIRSIKPVRVCVTGHYNRQIGGEGAEGQAEYVCDQSAVKTVVLKTFQSEMHCVDSRHKGGQDAGPDECLKYETINVAIPTKMNLAVFEVIHRDGQEAGPDEHNFLFTKEFVIPGCK